MGILEDVMKALDRIPAWKRVNALPAEVDKLAARVKALEDKLAPAVGEKCPSCGVMGFRLRKSGPAPHPWGEMGVRQDDYSCTNCEYTDSRQRNPG